MTWQDRFLEWKALLDYCSEHRAELERKGRMQSFVFCLQRHWQDKLRLKEQERVGG